MPALAGIAHITLSVRDRDDSVDFYRAVLGFREYRTRDEPRWLRTDCRHPSGLLLCITQHRDRFNARFDHQNAGLDHLAFEVSSLDELESWAESLDRLDVDRTPIVRDRDESMVMFEDPDGIQLELRYSPAAQR